MPSRPPSPSLYPPPVFVSNFGSVKIRKTLKKGVCENSYIIQASSPTNLAFTPPPPPLLSKFLDPPRSDKSILAEFWKRSEYTVTKFASFSHKIPSFKPPLPAKLLIRFLYKIRLSKDLQFEIQIVFNHGNFQVLHFFSNLHSHLLKLKLVLSDYMHNSNYRFRFKSISRHTEGSLNFSLCNTLRIFSFRSVSFYGHFTGISDNL